MTKLVPLLMFIVTKDWNDNNLSYEEENNYDLLIMTIQKCNSRLVLP